MDARALLLLAFAAAVVRGALFVQPPNVTIDEESCSLQVRWLPAEPPNSNCIPIYEVILRVNGTWDDHSKQRLETTSWTQSVPLGKEIDFKIKTSCQKPYENLSDWNDDKTFHVVQNGTAGTGARNLTCTWWNRKYMECSWSAGEKASPDTSYKLFYWYDHLDKGHQCRNFTREPSVFRCSFELEVAHVSLITVSVLGDSGNIPPSCFFFNSINSLVKCHPPNITHFLMNGSEVFLSWSKPCNLNNMDYEVEVDSNPRPFKDTLSATIQVEPNVRHTFRVRLKTETGQWSDWSKMVVLDGKTSTFLIILFILIPLCVALLLVVLLIYLKRIKLLILPKIPDPEKILKHMFEEQNENQPTHETANNEETHSLTIVEPAGNEK